MIKDIVAAHKGKVVDKWRSYLDVYDSIFPQYKDKPINILEIGVANGGSLEVWAEYFPNAEHIVGCDINPECGKLEYSDSRISVVVGDSNTIETMEKIIDIVGRPFDIIIDDGSHINADVIKTFALYHRYMMPKGMYIVEDLHTSYWDVCNGGLHSPLTAMAFFKRLVDLPNYEHWRINRTRKAYLRYFERFYETQFFEYNLSTINSVTFMNSMVIVKFNQPNLNKLGKRVVVGQDEHVMPEVLCINGIDVSSVWATAVDDWQYDPIAMVQRINQLGEQDDNPV